jgi:hypothetical protein
LFPFLIPFYLLGTLLAVTGSVHLGLIEEGYREGLHVRGIRRGKGRNRGNDRVNDFSESQ